jgi:uncharacterized membrane protein YhiD involved in acid resistance
MVAHGENVVNSDVLRVVHAVAIGVGFLGAGSIQNRDGRVKGLTTAAGIWNVAALASAAGLGFYALTTTLTVLAAFTLVVCRRFERPRARPEEVDPPAAGARPVAGRHARAGTERNGRVGISRGSERAGVASGGPPASVP